MPTSAELYQKALRNFKAIFVLNSNILPYQQFFGQVLDQSLLGHLEKLVLQLEKFYFQSIVLYQIGPTYLFCYDPQL